MPRPGMEFKSKKAKLLVDKFYIAKESIEQASIIDGPELTKANMDKAYISLYRPVEKVIRKILKNAEESETLQSNIELFKTMLSDLLQTIGEKTKEDADHSAEAVFLNVFNYKGPAENEDRAIEIFKSDMNDDVDIIFSFLEDICIANDNYGLTFFEDQIQQQDFDIMNLLEGAANNYNKVNSRNYELREEKKEREREKTWDEILPNNPTEKDLEDLSLLIQDAASKTNVADVEKYGLALTKAKQTQQQYERDAVTLAKFFDAKRATTMLESFYVDTKKPFDLTYRYNYQDAPFNEKAKEFTAILTKGDKLGLLSADLFTNGTSFKDDYQKAAGFVNALLIKTGFINKPIPNLADDAKLEYENKSLDDIKTTSKNEKRDRDAIRDYFIDCTTPEQYKTAMDNVISEYCNGNFALLGFEGEEKPSFGPANLQAGFYIAEMLKKDAKDKDFSLDAIGLSANNIKAMVEDKLDAADCAKEMLSLFRNQLNMNEDATYPTVPNNKNHELTNAAKSTYASLANMHSKHGILHAIFHPFKHYAEYSALKDMENILKRGFNFTDDELTNIKASAKDNSVDKLNMAYLKQSNPAKYNELINKEEQNEKDRADIKKFGLNSFEKGYHKQLNGKIMSREEINALQASLEINKKKEEPKINPVVEEKNKVVEEPKKEVEEPKIDPIEARNKAREEFKAEKEKEYNMAEALAVKMQVIFDNEDKYKDLYNNYYRKDEEFRKILASKELTEKAFSEKFTDPNAYIVRTEMDTKREKTYEEKAIDLKQQYLKENAGKVGMKAGVIDEFVKYYEFEEKRAVWEAEDLKEFEEQYIKDHPESMTAEEKKQAFYSDLQESLSLNDDAPNNGRTTISNTRDIRKLQAQQEKDKKEIKVPSTQDLKK